MESARNRFAANPVNADLLPQGGHCIPTKAEQQGTGASSEALLGGVHRPRTLAASRRAKEEVNGHVPSRPPPTDSVASHAPKEISPTFYEIP